MLLRLVVAPIMQGSRRRDPSRIRGLRVVHYRGKSLEGRWHMLSRQRFDLGNLLGPSAWIAALAFLKWFSNCHAVFSLFNESNCCENASVKQFCGPVHSTVLKLGQCNGITVVGQLSGLPVTRCQIGK